MRLVQMFALNEMNGCRNGCSTPIDLNEIAGRKSAAVANEMQKIYQRDTKREQVTNIFI